MIQERKRAVDAYDRTEEACIAKKSFYDEIRSRLRNMYRRREGFWAEVQSAKRASANANTKSVRSFVHKIAGKSNQDIAKTGIRRHYSQLAYETLLKEIVSLEDEAHELLADRQICRKELGEDRKSVQVICRELTDYAKALHPNARTGLSEYRATQRKYVLLERVCRSGFLYYQELKEVYRRIQGAKRIASRPLGERLFWEIALQEAYSAQGEEMSKTAERLQIEFLADLRTLAAMTGIDPNLKGKIAFSPYLFETTVTARLTQRKGDALSELLDKAMDESAELLYDLEVEKIRAYEVSVRCADAVGLAE